MILERGGWCSYRDSDGVIIPSNFINEEQKEDEVLQWEIVKWEPLVGSKGFS